MEKKKWEKQKLEISIAAAIATIIASSVFLKKKAKDKIDALKHIRNLFTKQGIKNLLLLIGEIINLLIEIGHERTLILQTVEYLKSVVEGYLILLEQIESEEEELKKLEDEYQPLLNEWKRLKRKLNDLKKERGILKNTKHKWVENETAIKHAYLFTIRYFRNNQEEQKHIIIWIRNDKIIEGDKKYKYCEDIVNDNWPAPAIPDDQYPVGAHLSSIETISSIEKKRIYKDRWICKTHNSELPDKPQKPDKPKPGPKPNPNASKQSGKK